MNRSPLPRLLALAAPFAGWMLLAAVLGVLTIGSSVALMATAAWIIARAALQPPIGTLSVAVVGVRFFGIARGVLRYLERLVSHEATFRLLARLRVWFYTRLEPLAPARLAGQHSGDLLTRLVADIDTLENIYLRAIAPPAVALLVTAVMAAFMAAYDWRLGVVLAAALLIAGFLIPLTWRGLSARAGRESVIVRGELAARAVDTVQGLADLLACNAAARHLAEVHRLQQSLSQHQRHMAALSALQTALISLVTGLTALAILILATPLVRAGRLEGVLLAVLVLAALSSFEAVQPLPAALQHLSRSLTAARRLFELADMPPAVRDPVLPCPLPPDLSAAEMLRVENLRFRYAPAEPPALDDVSFSVPTGAVVALVGPSGAGKSTLVALLLRFWDYQEGTIRLAGRDLRAFAQDDVRRMMSVVSQQTYLFAGTILDNLRLAHPSLTEEQALAALAAAELDGFVATLPDGLHTWIGEGGLRLSGGERQRLAIARAVLKDTPLLLLDEPTANLDPLTERAVLRTIFTALPGRTTLLITHRLIGLERARTILVLAGGRIVERGTHADLLQARGTYWQMWAAQQTELAFAQQDGHADETSTAL
ncbi:MAG: thiol reductant ABC exporter subunit CydC [Aggregatilineaceae bacterium]